MHYYVHVFKLVTFVKPFLKRHFLPGPVAPNRARLSENYDYDISLHQTIVAVSHLCCHGGGVVSRAMEHVAQPAPVLLVAVDVEVHRGVDHGQQVREVLGAVHP